MAKKTGTFRFAGQPRPDRDGPAPRSWRDWLAPAALLGILTLAWGAYQWWDNEQEEERQREKEEELATQAGQEKALTEKFALLDQRISEADAVVSRRAAEGLNVTADRLHLDEARRLRGLAQHARLVDDYEGAVQNITLASAEINKVLETARGYTPGPSAALLVAGLALLAWRSRRSRGRPGPRAGPQVHRLIQPRRPPGELNAG